LKTIPSNPAARLLARLVLFATLFAAPALLRLAAQPVAGGAVPAAASAARVGAITVRFNGQPVIGLGISMAKGGNILEVGAAVAAEMAKIRQALPVGVTVEQVADQPHVVSQSIEEFVWSLAEALAIVLVVSLISLGLRTGIVVALSVPLVASLVYTSLPLDHTRETPPICRSSRPIRRSIS
jgi:hypothetical protein